MSAVKTRTDQAAAAPRPSWRWSILPVAIILIMLTVGAFVVGRLTAAAPPGERSADAGFTRDMIVHHAQAVAMADTIRTRSQDPAMRTLAFDIVMTQQHQIGQMRGWLDLWGLLPNGLDLPMTWMGHPVARDAMPGMATPAELQQLAQAPLPQAEEQFLRLMIRHHQSGVEMAQAALDRASAPVARDLATGIVSSQQAEIGLMQSMLQARGLPPEHLQPSMPAGAAQDHRSHTPAPR